MPHLDRDDYKKYLRLLEEELQQKDVTGEILVADDVVVVLDVRNPKEADDVDAYFKGNGSTVYEVASSVAKQENLRSNWLYEALQQLLGTQPSHEKWIEYPGLRAYLSLPEYISNESCHG